jgi:cyclopropane fatty-acyl-phospholipid synthase-like methyltransferase
MEKVVIRQALKLANLKKGEIFYDLGCGNGNVLIEAAKMGAKAIGSEISPFYYLSAKVRTSKYSNIKIFYKNVFNVDFSKADVVYCYLMPEMLGKLAPKFKSELKAGSRLVSVGFPIKKMRKLRERNINSHKIFIYSNF